MNDFGRMLDKKVKKTLAGGLEHAVLSISVSEEREVEEKENKTVAPSNVLASVDAKAVSKMKNFTDNGFLQVAEAVKEIRKEAALGGETCYKWKNFEVQFNPESLSLQTRGDASEGRKDLGKKGKKKDFFPRDANTDLSLKLIFDETNFLAKTVSPKTVQNCVEGLMYAAGGANRAVIFTWGELSYEGFFNSMSAKYTMYDIWGRPMRAEVDLSISLAGILADRRGGEDGILSYWKAEYNDFMQGIDEQNLH